jgi:hypothetical protein
MQIGTTIMENSMEIKKLKIEQLYDPVTLPLGIYLKDTLETSVHLCLSQHCSQ